MASEIFGSLVAAVCVNLLIYSLEAAMAFTYLAKDTEKGTRKTAKYRTALNLLLDTAATIMGVAFLYIFQSSNWGAADAVQPKFHRIILAVLVLGTVTIVSAQSYLLERFWKNIRHHLLGTVVAISVLILAIVTSVAAVVACAYLEYTNPAVLIPFVWVSLICNIVAASGITIVSICQRFAMESVPTKTNILSHAFSVFIETGIASAIIAILAIIAWALGYKGTYVVALYFVQPRIYSATMLYGLLNPLPPRADGFMQEIFANSVTQKSPPAPPLSPDIYLSNDKTNSRLSLSEVHEDKGWFNIDLGNGESEEDAHRNLPFYVVPSSPEEKS
ncbi:hypothetical protein R3P38DRAFT_1635112 [Favolaschia claudopus]|uniref:Transmembrane protein n=1 Tax=Favolaschia claudopus TaxID=2862362 RepID=A0AAW0DLW2_9AGAR